VNEAAIAVDGLVKHYGGRAVVDGVSLEVGRGEIVAILGPNGAGKTTTVEIVEGYRQADAGTVRVLGEDPAPGGPAPRALRARIGLMLQGGGFDMRSRPRETLVQYARFHADPVDPGELMARLDLEPVADTPFRRLSGGERQRLGLAVALIGRPEVVVLDEPTAGMDPEGRVVVRELIGELRAHGVAMLLTSHDLTDVERLADRILVLVAGRVLAAGSPAELTAAIRPSLRFGLERALGAEERAALERALGGRLVPRPAGGLELSDRAPDPAVVLALATWCAAADIRILELRTGGGTLEDAYLELVGASDRGAG
jgi:ABC-2 type transport system ATP-binding protein